MQAKQNWTGQNKTELQRIQQDWTKTQDWNTKWTNEEMRCRWGDGLRNSSEGNEEMKQENRKEADRLEKTLRKGQGLRGWMQDRCEGKAGWERAQEDRRETVQTDNQKHKQAQESLKYQQAKYKQKTLQSYMGLKSQNIDLFHDPKTDTSPVGGWKVWKTLNLQLRETSLKHILTTIWS